MIISKTSSRDTTPSIRPTSKYLDPISPQPQILQNLRVSNKSLPSIILECIRTNHRIINSEQNFNKTKYVPITDHVVAKIYPKSSSKDLAELNGSLKSGRKIELIHFNINETKEVINITTDPTNYILLKAKGFQKVSEDAMSREIYFLEKYKNQPGILPMVAGYSYISKSSRKNIYSVPKKAIITRRLQDLFTVLANPKSQATLSSSIQQFDAFKREAKIQLLKAVLAIHAHGDIHRDIKPENILWEKVNESLRFYLIDFDISLNNSELNKSNISAGTYAYCDPLILAAVYEQSTCRDIAKQHEIRNKAFSPKNDIFSLGLMFYLLRESTHQLPDSIQRLMNEQALFPKHKIKLENLSFVPFLDAQPKIKTYSKSARLSIWYGECYDQTQKRESPLKKLSKS